MDFLEKLKSKNYKDLEGLVSVNKKAADAAKEFNNARDLRDTQVGKRQDKTVTSEKRTETVKVAKIPIPFQRQIVKSSATFMLGSPVKIIEKKSLEKKDTDGEAYAQVLELWDDIRMDSLLLKFCKTVKAETEATIVFFLVADETAKSKLKLKARLIKNENGNVAPIFDAFGDMIAFNWQYTNKEGDKEVTYWYIWTDEQIHALKKGDSGWEALEKYPQKNQFGKIPVVYQSQDNPEWWEVQDMIDRFEMTYSKFADTNDYFASPMYKATGAVSSIPKKDETGKLVKLDIIETEAGNIITSDLEVISWDRAPEAIKLEFETNKGLIYGLTDTPDLSFDNVKSIGNVTGIALKLMFLGPMLKAKDGEGDFRVSISRIINIIIAASANVLNTGLKTKLMELKVDIQFTSSLPNNINEVIQTLTEATAGKAVMSQKTAIAHNPMVDDVDEEILNLEEENVVGLGDTVE